VAAFTMRMIAYWLLKSKYFMMGKYFPVLAFWGPANFVPEVRLMMAYMAQLGREMAHWRRKNGSTGCKPRNQFTYLRD